MLNKSNLEVFVEQYLKSKKRNQVGIRFVQKAISLINQKLDSPCCNDAEAVISLYTPRENSLTIFVHSMLIVPKQGNVQSFTRTVGKLQRFLSCCQAPASPTNVIVSNVYPYSLNFTYVPGYENIKFYEYTTDSGVTYKQALEKPIIGSGNSNDITGDYPIGTVGVRVKSIYGLPPSATLYNDQAFLD